MKLSRARAREARRSFVRMGLTAVSAAGLWSSVAPAQARAHLGIDRRSGDIERTDTPYLVIYRAGPAWIAGKTVREQPLRPHGRYMLELYQRGVLRIAGRFDDGTGGAALFDAPDDAAARALIESDPAVQAQIFRFDLHRWMLVPWAQIAERQRAQ